MTDNTITRPPEFSRPSPDIQSVVVNLSMTSVPVPRLMDMRRDLISALQTVENLLGLPLEKRAIRNRMEIRRDNGNGE